MTMTKNDALLPCPFCGEQPQVNQFGGVVHDLDNEKAANCWLSCTSTENISEWQTRPTPAPLSNGDAIEDDGGFRKAIEEWVKKQRNALTYHPDLDSGLDEQKISQRSGGYAAYKNTLDFIKAYKATPSPVAVDAKAGDTRGLMMQVEDREEILQWVAIQKALYGMVKRRAIAKDDERGETATELAVRVMGLIEKALTAPNPDSKE